MEMKNILMGSLAISLIVVSGSIGSYYKSHWEEQINIQEANDNFYTKRLKELYVADIKKIDTTA